jgi:alpha-mannosidase
LSEDEYGVSLLNDCKYGYDIKDGRMRLTLLRSGTTPNPDADRESHEFTYSLYPHSGGWREGKTLWEAYDLNSPLIGKVVEKQSDLIKYDGNEFEFFIKPFEIRTFKIELKEG